MVTKVTTSYLFIWDNDLNEILHLIQFNYYFGKDLIFSRNKIRDQVDQGHHLIFINLLINGPELGHRMGEEV